MEKKSPKSDALSSIIEAIEGKMGESLGEPDAVSVEVIEAEPIEGGEEIAEAVEALMKASAADPENEKIQQAIEILQG